MQENHHIRIVPEGSGTFGDLAEMWSYRELLYILVWRDLAVLYKQTLLGMAWVVIKPLTSVVVFSGVFNGLAKIPSNGAPYPAFVLCGIIVWNFFSGAVRRAGGSLVSNRTLLKRVYFPRLVLPCAAAISSMADFLVCLVVVLFFMLHYDISFTPALLSIPFFALLCLFLSAGIGFVFAAANIRFQDSMMVLEYILRILLFLTPVVYPYQIIPEHLRIAACLNPLVGIIEGMRWAVLGGAFPLIPVLFSLAAVLIIVPAAHYYFKRVERTFADIA